MALKDGLATARVTVIPTSHMISSYVPIALCGPVLMRFVLSCESEKFWSGFVELDLTEPDAGLIAGV